MDINVICSFPDEFLTRVKSNSLIGPFFTHVNAEYYQQKIGLILTYLLSMPNDVDIADHDLIKSLYEKHRSMPLTRDHYKEFVGVFKDTLEALGANTNDMDNILHKLIGVCQQLHEYKYIDHFELLFDLEYLVANEQDLNAVRDRILQHLHILKNFQDNSGDLASCIIKSRRHPSFRTSTTAYRACQPSTESVNADGEPLYHLENIDGPCTI
jgi:truncated hemoglobin YjbI